MKKGITDFVCRICCVILFVTIFFGPGCAGVTNPYDVDSKQAQEADLLLHCEEPELEFPNPHPDAQWFPKASFGLFMNWGIHSVAGLQPSWTMLKDCDWDYLPEYEAMKYYGMKYYGLAKKFNPSNYEPDKWMAAAKKAGMTYAVLSAKHHDGYALWPSKYGNMSTRQYAGGRDLLKPYVNACRKYGLKVGFYFSPRDWYYPGYPMEAWNYDFNNFRKKTPPPIPGPEQNRKNFEKFYAYTIGQIRELLTRYGKIDVLWLDGQTWYGIEDHRTKETLAWIRSLQPGIVINDRWTTKRIGDFKTPERKLPKERPEGWWENCRSVNGHWGYNPNGIFWPASKMLERLVRARSWGGNFLMNVGPAPDGTMPEGFYERCGQLAEWMAYSGESVIGASPTPGDERSNVPITTGKNIWYLHVLDDHKGPVDVRDVPVPCRVELLRTGEKVSYTRDGENLIIELPDEKRSGLVDVIVLHWNNKTSKISSEDLTGEQDRIEALRQERKKLAHRRRRILVNDDGNRVIHHLKEASAEELVAPMKAGFVGTQIDTLYYCTKSSGFGMFTYNTKVGEIFDFTDIPENADNVYGFSRNRVREFIEQGTDCLEIVTDFCHENDIEIFWSMRMNDTHDADEKTWNCSRSFPQLKKDHPEWLMGTRENRPKRGTWTAVDYGQQEIRDLAFRFFEEVCENYDVDGVELDFFRHAPYFRTHAWGADATDEECDMMTSLLQRIRKMTERVGLERGRPILISVRVPDSVGFAKAMGLDIERWLTEGLIDVMVVTGYFRLNPWEESFELGHKYGVTVYPCLSESRIRIGESGRVRSRSLSGMECYRGRAMNVWAAGADGVYLFNYLDPNSCLWNEIGQPETLEKLDKVYCVKARSVSGANGWVDHGWSRFLNRPWWGPRFPLPLREGEVIIFYIDVGEDIGKHLAEGFVPDIKLRLHLPNVPGAKELTVVLNDHELVNNPTLTKEITLSSDIKAGEWFEYEVNPEIVKKGSNRIKLTLWHCGAKNPALADVLLWVRYPKSRAEKLQ